MVIGIAGVAMLLGIDAGGGGAALVGGLMIVLASFGYGVGAWFVKRRVRDVQPVAMVGATTATVGCADGAVRGAERARRTPPSSPPRARCWPWACSAPALAFVIFYSLVSSDGPAKASLVGYIAPGFSIVYGDHAARRELHGGHRRRAWS